MTKRDTNSVYSLSTSSTRRGTLKKFIACISAVMMLWQQAVFAQGGIAEADLDIDPPIIDHEALEVGVAGEAQTFAAVVIDDRGIEYVDLYYRPGRLSDYAKVSMVSDGNARYVATVATELAQSSIEYYIEAGDTGGNRVLKGFPFFPLVRNLDSPPPVAPVVTTTTNAEEQSSGSSKLLYVLLGALVVGLLASSGGSSSEGGEGQVPLTINISSPAE